MERTCNNCKRIGTKWCNKCVSTASKHYSKFKPTKTWLDSIFKECADFEKAMNELRSEKIITPTQEEEKNMEYKTKEELRSSIEKMETELAKMKEALNKAEEEDIWKPQYGEFCFSILGDFSTMGVNYYAFDNQKERLSGLNCFKTQDEANEAARDIKTLFMLYRLSRKSMEKTDKDDCFWRIRYDQDTSKMQCKLENGAENNQLFSFATHADLKQMKEIIGEKNLIELFKKF